MENDIYIISVAVKMNFVPKAKKGLLGYVFDNGIFLRRVDGVSSSKGVLPTCLARDVTVSKVTLKAVVSMSQMCRSDTLAASASLPRDKPIAFRATWRLRRANVWQISHGSLAGTSPVSAFTRLVRLSKVRKVSLESSLWHTDRRRTKPAVTHRVCLRACRLFAKLPTALSSDFITSNSDGIL